MLSTTPKWRPLGSPEQETANTRPTLDRLPVRTELEERTAPGESEESTSDIVQSMGDLAPYFTLLSETRQSRQRMEAEAVAGANFKRAKELAIQGIAVRDAGREDGEETLAELEQQEFLWEAALEQLAQIPEDSIFADLAETKTADYTAILTPVAEEIDRLQSAFLAAIAEETGRPQAIRISICHLSGECRDYKGDTPPASPASLIKLPVAVVLMHKVMNEGLDLDESTYIDPHNWTENANGAKIYVKHEYPLREVMVRMIKESNNIATNQLVDYLGWEYMDNTLQELGYDQTKIRTKLIGDRTAPTRNRSVGRNVMTTNEVTEMMRQVYTFTNPGDEEILDALVGQYDWDFGYLAVKQVKNKRIAWIGEKTGQNSKVIGSSLAVKIDDERYVMTVTIDRSGNQRMLRRVIGDVIQSILDDGHLVKTSR
ncbi:MAG: serine hydrolase [Cyanobacteria bacterium J06638_20]